ncbi:nucleotidyltransferase family protein [Methyloceanibacter sp.]|uniref:nucleotidyltransferase family protein n=1 Tax=Methyloceanibacter sp. TaxID=1965321 RepID=UPI003D6CDE5A
MTEMPPLALLAGGLATRLRPLTQQMPKAMIEVAGEPFIAHQLRLLQRERVSRVVLCVGYLWEQIAEFVGDGGRFGVNVSYQVDGPELLGTGGALRAALPELGSEFLVMYGDSWLDTAYAPIVDAFRASGKPALMTVFRNDGKWDTSNVWFDEGRIRCYDKAERLPQMRHIDWGLGILRSEVPSARSPGVSFDLASVYAELAQSGNLAGYEVKTRFYEIGSPDGLRKTDALLRGRVAPTSL